MADEIKQPIARYNELLLGLSDARKKLDSAQTAEEALGAVHEVLSLLKQAQEDSQLQPIKRLLADITQTAELVTTFDCTRQMLSAQINEAEIILKKLSSSTHSAEIVILL